MSVPKPIRRFQVTVQLGADTRKDAALFLRNLATEIERGGGSGVSGSPVCGGMYQTTEDESVTHESYHEALKHYLACLGPVSEAVAT